MGYVAVDDVSVEYNSGGFRVRAIDRLSFTVEPGEIVALVGPSGSGKTTILSCLGGILEPTRGTLRVDGVDPTSLADLELSRYRQTTVGFVFQAFNLLPSLTAIENVQVAALLAGHARSVARQRAESALERVGLGDRAGYRPPQLSGGQQQRVAIARGLVNDPRVLLADEPTANLDYIQAESVIRLFRELRDDDRSIVVATHDDRFVPIADRVIEMAAAFRQDAGPPKRVEVGRGDTVFQQGERGELVYVIEEGVIEIVRIRDDGSEAPIAQLDAGTYFGELGPTLGFPRSATARAVNDAVLTAYSVADFRARVIGQQAYGPA